MNTEQEQEMNELYQEREDLESYKNTGNDEEEAEDTDEWLDEHKQVEKPGE